MAEVSQIFSSTADQQTILKRVLDLLQQRFGLYHTGVFLMDKAREYAVLHYGTGEQGKQMLASSYRLAAGGYSLISTVIKSGQPQCVCENNEDSMLFENLFLPDTHSELALPIKIGSEVLGVLDFPPHQVGWI